MKYHDLLYVQEHISCKNYAAEGVVIHTRTINQGEYLSYGDNHRPFLCFLLQGQIRCRFDTKTSVSIRTNEMCFIMRGEIFWAEALEPATVLICFLDATIALCNEFTIKSLSEFLVKKGNTEDPMIPYILPINDILCAELNTARAAMDTGLLCYHYQREKRDIFLLMLRGFYSKIELAELFRPILSEDFDFKQTILQNYTPDMNVNDMIERSGMASASFNRRFTKAFGTTPRQWLAQKKGKSILCDLRMSDLTVKEIAAKYGFSSNYFIRFCQLHLGSSPAELRKNELVSLPQI